MDIIKKSIFILMALSFSVSASDYFNTYRNECDIALKEEQVELLKECVDKLPKTEYYLDLLKYNGYIFHKNAQHNKAEGYYLEFLDKSKNDKDIVTVSILLGDLYVNKSNYFDGIGYYSEANLLNEQFKNDFGKLNRAKIKIGINNIFYYLNIREDIAKEYQESINILDKINSREAKQIQVKSMFTLSIIESKLNHTGKALKIAKEALKISEKTNYLLGIGYAKKAIAYANLTQGTLSNLKDTKNLIEEAEEIFFILDIKDEVAFNIDILKIKLFLLNKQYGKAKERLEYLEKKHEDLNSKNYLKTVYPLFYELYSIIGNTSKALKYKEKSIDILENIRKEQDANIILKFKNEFYLSEYENKKEELNNQNSIQQAEIEKEQLLQNENLILIYIILTALFFSLVITLKMVLKRKQVLINKKYSDLNSMHHSKTSMARIYKCSNDINNKNKGQEKSEYCLISYKIKGIKDVLDNMSSEESEYFNLYLENEIKTNLRKGDLLLKQDGRLIIVAKSTSDESFYICLRVMNALSKNKYIKNNIFFGTTLLNSEGNNINSKLNDIDEKIGRALKSGDNYITT